MPRLLIRDSGTSLAFDGASTTTVDLGNVASLGFTSGTWTVAFWVKYTKLTANPQFVLAKDDVGQRGYALGISATGKPYFERNGAATYNGVTVLARNVWYHLTFVYDGTGVQVFVNGQAEGGVVATTNPPANTANVNIGRRAYTGFQQTLNGLIDGLRAWSTNLSAQQAASLYYANVVPTTNLLGEWKFNEGAGTTAADSSGNGLNGTITGATYSADVPMKPRSLVNRNLVKNGDFEYTPPFTAMTNTNSRWVDGTATGSATNDLFGWGTNSGATNATAGFDAANPHSGTASLKVSTLGTGSFMEVHLYRGGLSGRTATPYQIPVLPNTSYTCSCWMKTNYVSGDSGNGAALNVWQSNGDGTLTVTNNVTGYVKTTTGWTLYTVTFTTNAATRYIDIVPIVYGHTGAATLIMDAWFDDITLVPTTPPTRTLAGTRAAAGARSVA